MRFIREEPGKYRSEDGSITIDEASGKGEKVWIAREGRKVIAHASTYAKVRDDVLVLRGGPDPREMAAKVGGPKGWRAAFAYGVRVERLRAAKRGAS